jgi:hypothetical protein
MLSRIYKYRVKCDGIFGEGCNAEAVYETGEKRGMPDGWRRDWTPGYYSAPPETYHRCPACVAKMDARVSTAVQR